MLPEREAGRSFQFDCWRCVLKAYGTVEYNAESRVWKIACQPHVSMRLKRVFGKIGKHKVGTHVISDTPENARDIEWFLGRWPMNVIDSGRMAEQSQKYRDGASLVDLMMSGEYSAPAGRELAVPARQYQLTASSMALARRGLLLADDVGLGKTCSAIQMMADPRTLPVVVVTLTHLPRQWQSEINRFAPWLSVHIVKKGSPYDLTKIGRGKSGDAPRLFSELPDVIIINYHKLSGWAETLSKFCRAVVFDECQELRKTDSAKYGAAKLLAEAMEFRIGLSATPIYNYGGEFVSVLNCLCPGEVGTREEFCTEWCDGRTDDKACIKNPKAFGSYLRDSGIMLRRTRQDVGRELPGIQKVPHVIETDTATLDRVSGACAELARLILSDGRTDRGVKMRASEEFSNALRQATGIAKAPYVAEFVRLLLETGEKVVLYAWHREVYSILMERLKEFKPQLYSGSESIPQKEEAKRKFMAGETPLLLISLRSGAGLDGLQKVCRTVVFAELDWSPGVHEQCEGRVNRDGQPDPVIAYYLLAEDGSDPIVSQTLGIKKGQIEGVRLPEGAEVVIEKQMDGGHIRKLAEAYLGRKSAPVESHSEEAVLV